MNRYQITGIIYIQRQTDRQRQRDRDRETDRETQRDRDTPERIKEKSDEQGKDRVADLA